MVLESFSEEESYTSDEESRRCGICLRTIERHAESRTVRLAGSEFLAHVFCLLRLRRLACELYDTLSPLPTLNRTLTLNEFLLSMRPRSDTEILCCLAFYLWRHDSKMVLNEKTVQQQLRFSAFKISDLTSTLLEATDKFGYLRRLKNGDQDGFTLTEKGIHFVRRLPAESD